MKQSVVWCEKHQVHTVHFDGNCSVCVAAEMNQKNIRAEVRTLENHIKKMAPASKSAQIAIISKAQGMLIGDERNIAVLALVKNRIIRSK